MKNIFLLLLLAASAASSMGQIKALTETGDEVFLYENGTWKYVKEKKGAIAAFDSTITVNKAVFTKSKTATFPVKSKVVNVGVYINPDEWGFAKGTINESLEYRFRMKARECYGMLVTEKIEIPLINMPDIVLINAQKIAPDAEITKEEYRTVNGVKVLCIEFKGTGSGIKLRWMGYYYSGKAGTVQLVTYTSQSLFEENYKTMEGLLNGLVALPADTVVP